MSIQGSCGHILNEQDNDGHGWDVCTKEWSPEGLPSLAFHSCCTVCKTKWAVEGFTLDTNDKQRAFLNGES
ncbi:hypothetical protein [Neptuniibacter sp. QD37_11]|uniref:hypothetical protein n=1 Tax=Neptuniibacter sp. QD37_11 TaxID=3398209 RepID=UPI0039F62EF4